MNLMPPHWVVVNRKQNKWSQDGGRSLYKTPFGVRLEEQKILRQKELF